MGDSPKKGRWGLKFVIGQRVPLTAKIDTLTIPFSSKKAPGGGHLVPMGTAHRHRMAHVPNVSQLRY
jgi:hypothetical protein